MNNLTPEDMYWSSCDLNTKEGGYFCKNEENFYNLRKVSDNYECWKNGAFKFGFSDKLSFHNYFYESLLVDCFGTKGYGSVEVVLDIHHKSLVEFLKFLDLYGEDWK